MYYRKHRLIIPFLAPALILYGVFVLWPYAQSFYVSLTQWTGVSGNRPFIGLDNYRRLLDDRAFLNALTNNAVLLIVLPLGTITLALLFAALFTQGGRGVPGAGFYRVTFFFPQIISAVVVGILWSYIYHPNIGLLNGLLGAVGLEQWERTWLGDPNVILWAVAAVVIWQAVGFYMVLFIAGMQSIPTSFYEAATLDGANRWTAFRGITMPLMWENIRVALVYIGIAALDLFAVVQVLTGGSAGPLRSADVMALYMYDQAFGRSRFGYATAIGIVLLFMTLTLAVLTLQATKRETHEY